MMAPLFFLIVPTIQIQDDAMFKHLLNICFIISIFIYHYFIIVLLIV